VIAAYRQHRPDHLIQSVLILAVPLVGLANRITKSSNRCAPNPTRGSRPAAVSTENSVPVAVVDVAADHTRSWRRKASTSSWSAAREHASVDLGEDQVAFLVYFVGIIK
jgi:hypothetical protein